mmetsp:Transcript_104637/g.301699  ORF Transcript_104637/g.301699 Transcript_104637/m.301699 type:complete len:260 (-) Transcript_104637:362-1141(-)
MCTCELVSLSISPSRSSSTCMPSIPSSRLIGGGIDEAAAARVPARRPGRGASEVSSGEAAGTPVTLSGRETDEPPEPPLPPTSADESDEDERLRPPTTSLDMSCCMAAVSRLTRSFCASTLAFSELTWGAARGSRTRDASGMEGGAVRRRCGRAVGAATCHPRHPARSPPAGARAAQRFTSSRTPPSSSSCSGVSGGGPPCVPWPAWAPRAISTSRSARPLMNLVWRNSHLHTVGSVLPPAATLFFLRAAASVRSLRKP